MSPHISRSTVILRVQNYLHQFCPYCGKSGCEIMDGYVCGEPCACKKGEFCWWCGYNGMDADKFRAENQFPGKREIQALIIKKYGIIIKL